MSIETLHKEAFLASCDWKDIRKGKERGKLAVKATDALRGKNPQVVISKNTRYCLSNFQMSL